MDLTSSLEAKFGAKVQRSSPDKRKNLGSSVTTRRKIWKRITILGAFGVISEIQMAKFGIFVTYILEAKLGAPTGISEAKFGAKPPDLLILSTPWERNEKGDVRSPGSGQTIISIISTNLGPFDAN